MDAADLRAEKEDWTARALMYSREFLAATEAGDLDWEHNMKIALRQALAQVKRIDHLLKLGVAA